MIMVLLMYVGGGARYSLAAGDVLLSPLSLVMICFHGRLVF